MNNQIKLKRKETGEEEVNDVVVFFTSNDEGKPHIKGVPVLIVDSKTQNNGNKVLYFYWQSNGSYQAIMDEDAWKEVKSTIVGIIKNDANILNSLSALTDKEVSADLGNGRTLALTPSQVTSLQTNFAPVLNKVASVSAPEAAPSATPTPEQTPEPVAPVDTTPVTSPMPEAPVAPEPVADVAPVTPEPAINLNAVTPIAEPTPVENTAPVAPVVPDATPVTSEPSVVDNNMPVMPEQAPVDGVPSDISSIINNNVIEENVAPIAEATPVASEPTETQVTPVSTVSGPNTYDELEQKFNELAAKFIEDTKQLIEEYKNNQTPQVDAVAPVENNTIVDAPPVTNEAPASPVINIPVVDPTLNLINQKVA